MAPGGKLTSLACHPTKKSKQSWVTNIYLYKYWRQCLRLSPTYLDKRMFCFKIQKTKFDKMLKLFKIHFSIYVDLQKYMTLCNGHVHHSALKYLKVRDLFEWRGKVILEFLLSLHHYKFWIGNGEKFKITFVIAHQIGDRILWIVKCNQIALHLYSLATNPNTDKPIDIRIRLNRWILAYRWKTEIKLFVNSCKYS
jgi:hypothetical protein